MGQSDDVEQHANTQFVAVLDSDQAAVLVATIKTFIDEHPESEQNGFARTLRSINVIRTR